MELPTFRSPNVLHASRLSCWPRRHNNVTATNGSIYFCHSQAPTILQDGNISFIFDECLKRPKTRHTLDGPNSKVMFCAASNLN